MFRCASAVFLMTVLPQLAVGQDGVVFPEAWAEAVAWRSIGPANMSGRIVALSVSRQDPSLWFAATASGGLLKTTNDGNTFEHLFDREKVVSIGDVQVAPSNHDIVYVGTGEGNPRNSSSWGNGVYRSSDGGKTWKHVGLEGTFQTGRMAVHPTDPNVVYVGALGRLWGTNEERGLYKTTDGGQTWSKILYVDDKTGVMEIAMHPKDPQTLLVATYERQRDGFDGNDPAKKHGPGSGLWKTQDGGATWKRIREGLPSGLLGRIGLSWHEADPNIVFATVESERIGEQPTDAPYIGVSFTNDEAGPRVRSLAEGSPAKDALREKDLILMVDGQRVKTGDDVDLRIRQRKAGEAAALLVVRDGSDTTVTVTLASMPEGDAGRSPFGTRLGGQIQNIQDRQGPDGHENGGVYKSTDGGESWTRVNSLNPRPMYFSQIRVDPNDPNEVYVLGISLHHSSDGGKTFRSDAGRGVHADQHAMWIDPRDGRHIILGCDGGIYVTRDRCGFWDHLNHVAIGQFYHVGVGPRRNYRVFGGLQDNGSWGGPSRSRQGSILNEDWIRVGGGDGFLCRVDPNDPNVVFFESQNGGSGWRNLDTGQRGSLRPQAPRGTTYRFNWETPFVVSAHNSRIIYLGGNHVFRSLDRGERMRAISDEITRTDQGSASALAESPRDEDIIWVGTDDGALWVTEDGGRKWVDCWGTPAAPEASVAQRSDETPAAERGTSSETDPASRPRRGRGPRGARAAVAAVPGRPLSAVLPGPRWISEIAASAHETRRAFVTVDGHRSDDDTPYILMTEDLGKSWVDLSSTLPKDAGSARTIAEHPKNPDLLFLGTEFRAYVSLDRGQHWTPLQGALPTVAIHAFAIHEAAGEMVAATHGRSLWVADISALHQMTAEVMAKAAHLYAPVDAVIWKSEPGRGGTNRRFEGANPPNGATLVYHLKAELSDVSLEILDGEGQVVRTLEAKKTAGLHRVVWDLRRDGRPGDDPRARRFQQRPRVSTGVYVARLTTAEGVQTQPLQVTIDPEYPSPTWVTFEDAAVLDALEAEEESGDR